MDLSEARIVHSQRQSIGNLIQLISLALKDLGNQWLLKAIHAVTLSFTAKKPSENWSNSSSTVHKGNQSIRYVQHTTNLSEDWFTRWWTGASSNSWSIHLTLLSNSTAQSCTRIVFWKIGKNSKKQQLVTVGRCIYELKYSSVHRLVGRLDKSPGARFGLDDPV